MGVAVVSVLIVELWNWLPFNSWVEILIELATSYRRGASRLYGSLGEHYYPITLLTYYTITLLPYYTITILPYYPITILNYYTNTQIND